MQQNVRRTMAPRLIPQSRFIRRSARFYQHHEGIGLHHQRGERRRLSRPYEALREKNDSHINGRTALADQGRIAAWKDLLALANPAPAPIADAGGY